MKKILISIISLGFLVLFPIHVVFASTVGVQGKVDNPNVSTAGSTVLFKNSTTHEVVSTVPVGMTGAYFTSIPAGTYDITVIPPPNSKLTPITKTQQNITSNKTYDLSFPSEQSNLSLHNLLLQKQTLYLAVGIVILIAGVLGFLLFKRGR